MMQAGRYYNGTLSYKKQASPQGTADECIFKAPTDAKSRINQQFLQEKAL